MAHAVEMATDLQQSSGSDMAHSSPAPSNPSTSRARSKPRSRSRPARPRQNSSPARASSPHELPTQAFSPEEHSDGEEEVEEADTLSPFDPRRITPTLHASLVSEILSLRREVENKTKAIDSLELSLDESRIEGETLSANLSHATREARSLKHQIQLLEGGTSSAMTELARERDEAVENITDVRKKLEQVQKRARSREEDAERTQMLWDRDRENWENERRNLERKVHVVEGRLKTVLNEVAAAHEAGNLPSQNGESDGAAKDQIKASDNASVASSGKGQRRGSMASLTSEEGEGEDEDENQADYHNVRYSVMSVAPGPQNGSGLNLAQELDFDEQDEFAASDEDETPESPEALPEERPMSVHSQGSYDVASKARRILGLSMQSTDSATAAAYRALDHNSPAKTQETTVQYQDMGIQYSPPPSPKMSAPTQENAEPVSADTVIESKGEDGEEEETPEMKDTATITIGIEMVSTSCQTIGDLPSPPWTPKIPELESPTQSVEESAESVQMVSASIQTEPMAEMEPAKEERATLSPTDIPAEMDIPMIAIHPPGSEPASPRDSVVLPPQTRNVSVQTNFRSVVEGRSIAIQTEEIRIDTRKLPASLLPSAIQDVPPRYEAQDANIQPYRAPVPPPRSAKREQRPRPGERATKPPSAPKTEPAQAYPGNNDNGPLSDDVGPGIRRPFRSSSLFAGFEQLSDDEGPHGEERDIFTDDELLNRPFAAYKIRRGKLVNAAKSRTSWDDLGLPEIDEHLSDPESRPSEAGRSSSRTTQRSGATAASSRQSGMRRMAMISNGASAHQKTRTRSPSEPSLDSGSAGSSIAPPFPVPIRLSSRNIPLHGSDGPPSPTRSAGRHFSDRGQESLARQPTLRRVRSAAAMSQSDAADRSEMRESPVPSTSPFAADSPRRLPRMPFDDYPAPRERQSVQKQTPHQATASVNWTHERQDSTGGVQPTSVVDAIAQTMVGEWMYKYVRRRKSFGMGDSKDSWEGKNVDEVSANITTSGVRHKRWVWLAPYEGSIMWSNKQPTSGPALLGKTGRKCQYIVSYFWSCNRSPAVIYSCYSIGLGRQR